MSAVERASEASSVEQTNEWAVRVNEQADEQMAQYSTRQFHILSTNCAVAAVMAKGVCFCTSYLPVVFHDNWSWFLIRIQGKKITKDVRKNVFQRLKFLICFVLKNFAFSKTLVSAESVFLETNVFSFFSFLHFLCKLRISVSIGLKNDIFRLG